MKELFNEKKSQSEDRTESRYLIFNLAKDKFAIPLLSVKEVLAVPTITPIPATPPHVLGIMDLRGQVIPIVDLALKLKIKDSQRSSESAVIILEINSTNVGIIVSSVDNVLSLPADKISDRPSVETTQAHEFISGVAKNNDSLILMMDIPKLIGINEIKTTKIAA